MPDVQEAGWLRWEARAGSVVLYVLQRDERALSSPVSGSTEQPNIAPPWSMQLCTRHTAFDRAADLAAGGEPPKCAAATAWTAGAARTAFNHLLVAGPNRLSGTCRGRVSNMEVLVELSMLRYGCCALQPHLAAGDDGPAGRVGQRKGVPDLQQRRGARSGGGGGGGERGGGDGPPRGGQKL
eukprot:SAG31_NODE_1781_length_7282_cov_1.770291_1_plen_182_part_00